MNRRFEQHGVTLAEMLVVVTIISLMVGVGFPAVTSGLETLRLSAATNSVVSFWNSALNRAERRQQVMEITLEAAKGKLTLRSAEPGFVQELELPEGINVTAILPADGRPLDEARRYYIYPGGTVPRVGVVIENRKHLKRTVSVDPISGVPQIQ